MKTIKAFIIALILCPSIALGGVFDDCWFNGGFQMERQTFNKDGALTTDGNFIGSLSWHCHLGKIGKLEFEHGPSMGMVVDSSLFEDGRKTLGYDLGVKLLSLNLQKIGIDSQLDFTGTLTPHMVIPDDLVWREFRRLRYYGIGYTVSIPIDQLTEFTKKLPGLIGLGNS